MKAKFSILQLVTHVLDPDKKPMMILGVVERPQHYSYLCTSYDNTENEYLEQELKTYLE